MVDLFKFDRVLQRIIGVYQEMHLRQVRLFLLVLDKGTVSRLDACNLLGLSQPAAARHINKLMQLGLINQREGAYRLNFLDITYAGKQLGKELESILN